MTVRLRTIKKRHVALVVLAACFIWLCVVLIIRTPSNDRAWSEDQTILPYAEFDGDTIHIKNIRNFEYLSRDEYIPAYYDKTVDINDLVSVDYIVEPLASVAAAHTLLSFGFIDGSRVAISVEIRKEEGEEFSPTKGVFEEYELMYVIVDERDALVLRAVHRDNPVYVYPTLAQQADIQKLFISMLQRATALTSTPEFYNTLTNTCATNIADHINEITPGKISWDYRLLLPKDSDVLAYELGFIDNSVALEDLRATYLLSEQIKEHVSAENFSQAIRGESTTTDSVQ